jgi:hypothetical protein
MIVQRQRFKDAHHRRCVVTRDGSGWKVREEEGMRVVREMHHTDWHRVERALHLFEYGTSESRRETNAVSQEGTSPAPEI